MARLDDLLVNIKANASQYEAEIRKAKQATEDFVQSVKEGQGTVGKATQKATKSIISLKVALTATAAGALTAIVAKSAAANKSFSSLRDTIKPLSKSLIELGTKGLKQLNEFSTKSVVLFKDLVDKGLKRLTPILKSITKQAQELAKKGFATLQTSMAALTKSASAFIKANFTNTVAAAKQATKALSDFANKGLARLGINFKGIAKEASVFASSLKDKAVPAIKSLSARISVLAQEGLVRLKTVMTAATAQVSKFVAGFKGTDVVATAGNKISEAWAKAANKFPRATAQIVAGFKSVQALVGKLTASLLKKLAPAIAFIGVRSEKVRGAIAGMKVGFKSLAEGAHTLHKGLTGLFGKTFSNFVIKMELVQVVALGASGAMAGFGVSLGPIGVLLNAVALGAGFAITGLASIIGIVGQVSFAIGTDLVNATELWSAKAISMQKIMFTISTAFETYVAATNDTSLSLDELTAKSLAVAKATGFAQESILSGIAVNLELARVTGLTSEQMVKVVDAAANVAAFFGQDLQQVIFAIDQAFRGVSQGIEQGFGLNLALAGEEAEHMAKSLGLNIDALSHSEEALLRYNILLKQTEQLQNAAAESAQQTQAGAYRRLDGAINNLHQSLGKGTSSIWIPYTNAVASGVEAVASLPEPLLSATGFAASLAGQLLQLVGVFFNFAGKVLFAVGALNILNVVLKSTIFTGLLGMVGITGTAANSFLGLGNIVRKVASFFVVGFASALKEGGKGMVEMTGKALSFAGSLTVQSRAMSVAMVGMTGFNSGALTMGATTSAAALGVGALALTVGVVAAAVALFGVLGVKAWRDYKQAQADALRETDEAKELFKKYGLTLDKVKIELYDGTEVTEKFGFSIRDLATEARAAEKGISAWEVAARKARKQAVSLTEKTKKLSSKQYGFKAVAESADNAKEKMVEIPWAATGSNATSLGTIIDEGATKFANYADKINLVSIAMRLYNSLVPGGAESLPVIGKLFTQPNYFGNIKLPEKEKDIVGPPFKPIVGLGKIPDPDIPTSVGFGIVNELFGGGSVFTGKFSGDDAKNAGPPQFGITGDQFKEILSIVKEGTKDYEDIMKDSFIKTKLLNDEEKELYQEKIDGLNKSDLAETDNLKKQIEEKQALLTEGYGNQKAYVEALDKLTETPEAFRSEEQIKEIEALQKLMEPFSHDVDKLNAEIAALNVDLSEVGVDKGGAKELERLSESAKELLDSLSLEAADEISAEIIKLTRALNESNSDIDKFLAGGQINQEDAVKARLQAQQVYLTGMVAVEERITEMQLEELAKRVEAFQREGVTKRLKLENDLLSAVTDAEIASAQLSLEIFDDTEAAKIKIMEASVENKQLLEDQLTLIEANAAKERIKIAEAAADEKIRTSGSFFEKMQLGFKEFVNAVAADTDTLSTFWANTLTQISTSFSDLIFNVLKGNFDSLQDIVQGAMDAILKSFIDLVVAIAAREIIIKVGVDSGLLSSDTLSKLGIDVGKVADAAGGGSTGADNTVQYSPPPRSGIPPSTLNTPTIPNPGVNAESKVGDKVAGGLIVGGAIVSSIGQQIGGTGGDIISAIGTIATLTGVGFQIGGPIGAAIGAAIGLVLGLATIIQGLMNKRPKLDLDFDQFRDEMGKSIGIAAKVKDYLNEDLFNDEIFNVSQSRKAGLGVGGEGGIAKLIREVIEGTIEDIQSIINQLPTEMATQLNAALLDTDIDIESEVKGDRLLEFHETGKNIAEKFQKFIEGDLSARFIASIRTFFVGAFESLGALSENAQRYVDDWFEEFQDMSREERMIAGPEFLEDFQTFVDGFNVVAGRGIDGIGVAINEMNNLALLAGFEDGASIGDLAEIAAKIDMELTELADDAPEAIQALLDYRSAILDVTAAIGDSIQSLVSFISSLNDKIVELGGTAIDVNGALLPTIQSSMDLISGGDLSSDELEFFLGQMSSQVDQWVQGELQKAQAAQDAAAKAAQDAAQAQIDAINSQITALDTEAAAIQKNAQARIDALNEEAQIAQGLEALAKSIQDNINDLLLSPGSIENPFQRLTRAQGMISTLQNELPGASGERRIEIGGEIQQLLNDLLSITSEVFANPSVEFRDAFRETIEELEALKALIEPARSSESILAEIELIETEANAKLESIESQIGSLQDQAQAAADKANNIANQQVQLSDEIKAQALAYYEFMRDEAIKLLETRLEQLADLGIVQIDEYSVMENIAIQQLLELKAIKENLTGNEGFEPLPPQYIGGPGGNIDPDTNLPIEKPPGAVSNPIPPGADITTKTDPIYKTDPITGKRVIGGISDLFPIGYTGYGEGSNGFLDFGKGTLAILHGLEAVVPHDKIAEFVGSVTGSQTSIGDLASQLGGGGTISGLASQLGGGKGSKLGDLRDKLFGGGGFISDLARNPFISLRKDVDSLSSSVGASVYPNRDSDGGSTREGDIYISITVPLPDGNVPADFRQRSAELVAQVKQLMEQEFRTNTEFRRKTGMRK